MPGNSYNLETEFNYFSSALIIDEKGEVSSHLVDTLLSQGYLVNYFGVENKENFYYLEGKKNFNYLNNFSEVQNLQRVDYLFCFSLEKQFTTKETLFWLTKKNSCKILICLPLDTEEKETFIDLLEEKELNIRLVFYDCFFGPRIKKGLLGNLFTEGIRKKEIIISKNPNQTIYPISAESLTREITSLIFLPETKSKSYFIKSSETTLQDFIDKIKMAYPDIRVNVVNSEFLEKKINSFTIVQIKENFDEKIHETLEWFIRHVPEEPVWVEKIDPKNESIKSETYSIPVETKEQEVFSHLPAEDRLDFLFENEKKKEIPLTLKKEKLRAPKESPKPHKKTVRKKFVFGVSIFVGLLLIFFTTPFVLTAGAGFLGVRQLFQLKTQIEEGTISSAAVTSNFIKSTFDFSQKTLSLTNPFYSLIGLQSQTQTISETFRFTQNLNDSIGFSLIAAEEVMSLGADFFKGEGLEQEDTLSSIKSNLSFAYQQASLAQSSLETIRPVFEFFKQTDQHEELKKTLPEIRELFLKSQNLIGVLPKILGFSERRTYLVLFQNNTELRPTGGFIGSYGLVNLEGGRLVSFEVYDVYQADGQLKGHVEPPLKLKQYLGEATWYLRDSNWDPDFTVSAPRAQWFLDKEMQIKVDGTIGITLEVAKNVLAGIGEVEVPEYGEKINQNNLFQKAEYYSEVATFPGSTQKKDFLGSLAKAIFEKIKYAEEKELINVGRALFASLESREMLLYFNDPEPQTMIARLGWEGSVKDFSPKSDKTFVFADYLHLNEANVGINKANFFVTRKIDHQIRVDERGKAEERLLITYDNQSPSENWPAGKYKTYLRLYLPKGTRLTSSLITDPESPSLWLPFDMKYFDNTEDHGKSVFGYLLEVPIKSKLSIEIKYENLQTVSLSQKINSYLLMVQKQPGSYPSDYTLTFFYPQSLVPVRVIPSAVAGSGQLLVSSKLDKDRIFQIDLAR